MVLPSSVLPLRFSKPQAVFLLPCFAPPSTPAVGWRRELEAQKAKIMGRDKNKVLETAMR